MTDEAPATPATIIDKMLATARRNKAPLSEVMTIDAPMAAELLKRNTNNRDVSRSRVKRYRADMAAGRWTLNYQPIIVTSDGVLADGQKRALAVHETDLSFQSAVVVGVEPAARATMDQVQPRSAGDFLKMRGEALGGVEASIVRLLLAYDTAEGEALRGVATPSAADVIAYFDAHADEVRSSAALAEEYREPARYYAAPSMLGFIHCVTRRTDQEKADLFLAAVAKGEGLAEADPAYQVRARLLAMGRAGASKKAETMLLGWRAFQTGKTLKTIRLTGRLPAVT